MDFTSGYIKFFLVNVFIRLSALKFHVENELDYRFNLYLFTAITQIISYDFTQKKED